ncbi:MAG: histidine phosphatase family protein [Armatimonadetes bacterium]|nr:histidine phosphatase family protein [Armatimonadota bacterium]MDE2206718.1 histidine phosphatase family protein [Armatimonadota bacterium]
MQIYLLRHGIAEDAGPNRLDTDRRLTQEGVARMRLEAEGMARAGIRPEIILSSPKARAWETAAITAETLEITDRLQRDSRLADGPGLQEMREIAMEFGNCDSIMLVGHQPYLSLLAGILVGSAHVEVKKGGLVRVDCAEAQHGSGVLTMLLPPGILARLGQNA